MRGVIRNSSGQFAVSPFQGFTQEISRSRCIECRQSLDIPPINHLPGDEEILDLSQLLRGCSFQNVKVVSCAVVPLFIIHLHALEESSQSALRPARIWNRWALGL